MRSPFGSVFSLRCTAKLLKRLGAPEACPSLDTEDKALLAQGVSGLGELKGEFIDAKFGQGSYETWQDLDELRRLQPLDLAKRSAAERDRYEQISEYATRTLRNPK
jgi:hypothetical protein